MSTSPSDWAQLFFWRGSLRDISCQRLWSVPIQIVAHSGSPASEFGGSGEDRIIRNCECVGNGFIGCGDSGGRGSSETTVVV